MTECKGITKVGKKCRGTATRNGYCRWHYQANECVVCMDNFEEGELPLPCGHWVHRRCVQRGADAMQDLRSEEGYPPIEECICPVCRTPVSDLKPKEIIHSAPPLQINIILTTDEIYTAFLNWQQSDRVAPLSWYIWVTLCEKYPSYDYDGLVTIAYVFADLINSEDIVPRPPSPDHRFQRVLTQVWR